MPLPSPNPTTSYWQTTYPHPSPPPHYRSTPTLPAEASVVVIGSGITGCFATRKLLEENAGKVDGFKVVVLEARGLCGGATGRNGGHVQPNLYSQAPSVSRFELLNYDLISKLACPPASPREASSAPNTLAPFEFEWQEQAVVHAFFSHNDFDHAKEQVRALPTDLSNLVSIFEDPTKLRAEFQLGPGAVGAVVQQKAASCHPYKLIMGLWRHMIRKHSSDVLNIQTDTPVMAIEPAPTNAVDRGGNDDGAEEWHIHTSHRGTVKASQILLATNAYTSSLLPQRLSCLIVPVRGQMSALVPSPNPSPPPTLQLHHTYAFLCTRGQSPQMDDYLIQRPLLLPLPSPDRFFGNAADTDVPGTNRLGGVVCGGEFMFGGGRFLAPNGQGVGVADDSDTDGPVADHLHSLLPEVLGLDLALAPALGQPSNGDGTETQDRGGEAACTGSRGLESLADWTGIMGFSADGMPWVGMVPGMQGVWICAGYSGHGMVEAPGCAGVVAEGMGRVGRDGPNKERSLREWEEDVRRAGMPLDYLIGKERMQRLRLVGRAML